MTLNTIGDQARAFAMQSASNRLKTTMSTLTQEMASGEVADLGLRLQGNTRALNEIENRIGVTRQLQRNASEAAIQLQAMQDMFGAVRTTTEDLRNALISDTFADSRVQMMVRGIGIGQTFEAVVQHLNGANSNRFLLSGQASTVAPLSSPTVMLDALEALTAGMTSATEVATAISDWFDAPAGAGGFLDTAYHGTLDANVQIPISEGIAVNVGTTAASPAVRDLLKGIASIAILSRNVLAGNPEETRQLMSQAGMTLMNADMSVVGEMSRIGLSQQITERAQSANTASLYTLERGRNDIRRADPYETATALAEVQAQLDSHFAVTARLSKLRLVDYLR
ncbi:MAG: hypothetical protein FJX25_10775 [Alphaproteobacteria bacterium]|nr:hypothetical protein [Alphaproteobacteria bacterium]